MKAKGAAFKNPFELMDEQQEQIIDLKPNNYVPKSNKSQTVHTPLPFNPYQSGKNNKKLNQSVSTLEQSSVSKNSYKQKSKPTNYSNSNSFSNPFGNESQNISMIQNSSKSPIGFNPNQQSPSSMFPSYQQKKYTQSQLNVDGDPPLLQDIGIDLGLIKQRIIMIIKTQKPDYQALQNSDLSGPIIIAMTFGCLLLLSGKVHFGDIYAMFIFGNLLVYFLINLMSQKDIVPLYGVMSTLGYSLLPMLILGFFGIFVSLNGSGGILLSLSISIWSSYAAGNILEVYLKQPHNSKKVLVVYPLFLFYLSFAMIVIF